MNRNLRKGFLWALLLLVTPLTADEIKTDFFLGLDSERSRLEYAQLGGALEYRADLPDRMELRLAADSDSYEVNPRELTFRWKAGENMKFALGYDRNALTLEEDLSSYDRNPREKGLLSEFMEFQGYVGRGFLYDMSGGETLEWQAALAKPYVHHDFQAQGSLSYPFRGDDTYLSLYALYLPRAAYSFLFEEAKTIDHYYAFTLALADYRGPFFYALETSLGRNMTSPLGILSLPPDETYALFAGADGRLGYSFDFDEVLWQPALRYSLLFPGLSYAEYWRMELLWGNRLETSSKVSFYADMGLSWDRRYGLAEQNDSPTPVWEVGVLVSATSQWPCKD